MNQNIFTLHSYKRSGFSVNKRRYLVMREYILSTLRREGDVSIDALLDEASNEFKVGFDGGASWYVLVVKLDHEDRGVIKSTIVIISCPRATHKKNEKAKTRNGKYGGNCVGKIVRSYYW